MLCDNCKTNTATLIYKVNKNGMSNEYHLCSACAAKLGFQNIYHNGFGVNSLLSNFMNNLGTQEVLTCSVCKTTKNTILKTGKVGCANCYETFSGILKPYIKRIQRSTAHTGKTSGTTYSGQKKKNESSEIEKLKNRLNEAVSEQNYEEAAILRDRIRAMERTNEE